MKPKITVKKAHEKYELFGEKENISVLIASNGKITLITNDGETQFMFVESDPGRVKRMGELLMKASEVSGYV